MLDEIRVELVLAFQEVDDPELEGVHGKRGRCLRCGGG